MFSIRKLEANRANAAKSTGPRTAAGKAASAMNAVRHGLRAEAVVIPGESAEEYAAFRDAVRESLAPTGLAEELLVEQIALAWWRGRREYRHEAALARAEVADLTPDFGGDAEQAEAVRADAAAARRDAAFVRTLAGGPTAAVAGGDAVHLLARLMDGHYSDERPVRGGDPFDDDDDDDPLSSFAVTLPSDLLAAAEVPEEWARAPGHWPGWTVGGVRRALEAVEYEFWEGSWEERVDRIDRYATAAAVAAEATLAERARQLEEAALTAAERAQIEDLAAVPPEDKLRPLLRYAAHNQKQLAQLLDRLERLQAARRAAESAPDVAKSTPDADAPLEAAETPHDGAAPPGADEGALASDGSADEPSVTTAPEV